jgi:hypothetical protein
MGQDSLKSFFGLLREHKKEARLASSRGKKSANLTKIPSSTKTTSSQQ